MNRALKIIFVWLMFFALPMQGVAAATMIFCGNGGHHAQMAKQDMESMHDHEGHADHHQHAQHPQDNAQTDQPTDQGQSKCSVCAACCLGVSIVAPTWEMPSVVSSTQLISFIPHSFSNLTLKGLERPPFPYSM